MTRVTETMNRVDINSPQSLNPAKTEFLRLQRDFSPGTVIENAFEIKGFMELGGMGYLFKGYHRRLRRDIAIKVLKGQWISGGRSDFLAEGHQMARVHHQYVARIYDVGTYKNHTYLVMDYIDGKNLYKYFQEKKMIPPDTALDIMIKLATALSAVHQEGIIHRDIKPANIMINSKGDPVLLDFGISRCENGNGGLKTPSSHKRIVTGTPEFMAPECYKNGYQISPASDVYSLGKTFRFILNGSPLQRGNGHEQMTTQAQTAPQKLPEKFDDLIERMTHEDPALRPTDGKSVLQELRIIKKSGRMRMTPKWLSKIVVGLLFLFLAVSSYRYLRPSDWNPRPRVIAVIPNSIVDGNFSYIPYEFEKKIRNNYPYYDLVDRNNIKKTIEELELVKDGWISKTNSTKIGEMVGAQIFIMFEKGAYNNKPLIYSKAYDIETTLLLGHTRIEPQTHGATTIKTVPLTQSVNALMQDIAKTLTYRGVIKSVDERSVTLAHGQLHGAMVGMTLRVLNRADDTIALLKITTADKYEAEAAIIKTESRIKKGMRVQEVKENARETSTDI